MIWAMGTYSTCMHIYMHLYMHAHIHALFNACTYTCTYTCMHTYMHLYMHAPIHARTHRLFLHVHNIIIYICFGNFIHNWYLKCVMFEFLNAYLNRMKPCCPGVALLHHTLQIAATDTSGFCRPAMVLVPYILKKQTRKSFGTIWSSIKKIPLSWK